MQNLAPLYGIKEAKEELISSGTEDTDHLGFRHQKLKQMYRGLDVVGADLRVHFDNTGTPYQVSGRYVPGISLDIQPKITGDQASGVAMADFLRRGFAQPKIIEKPQLVIYALQGNARLAYQLVLGDKPTNRYRYWIDATDSSVIQAINLVCSIVAPSNQGTPATLQGSILPGEGGGVLSFAGWNENGVFYMNDPFNFYYVFNNNGSTSDPPAFSGISQNGAYPDAGTYAYRSTANWGQSDPAEVSIAVNMAYTFSYYKNIHNRNGIDGRGLIAPAVAHYDIDLVNAYWTGSYMAFGDGDRVTANCLAVLDVCGHEVTHGVTQATANLVYQNESGALNESFSDIFGANIEFNFQADNRSNYPTKSPGTSDWLCGEDCWLSSTALRDLRNPANASTVGTGVQPTRYKGTYWYTGSGDNGGVHQNSGVQNFFYYLLCEGGSGNNNGIPYSVSGINIVNARQIAYRALTVYCGPSTDYKAVRKAWTSAAEDLQGGNNWSSSVQAAWDAVGVVEARITSAKSIKGVVNHPLNPYLIKATDFPNSWKAEGLPPGLRINSATISGTPTAPGAFAVALTVTTLSDVISDTLLYTISEPPPYDDFAQARDIGTISDLGAVFPISLSGTNDGYSREVGEPSHVGEGPFSSVWFKIKSDRSGVVTVDTDGSDFDTTLAVYQGASLSKLTKIAANNDKAVGTQTSLVKFTVNAGSTYYIAVDGNKGAVGNYVLRVSAPSPPLAPVNDPIESAENLGSETTLNYAGTTASASAQKGEPSMAGFAATRSVWFLWTAPATGEITIDTVGSSCDTVLGLYSGSVAGTNWSQLKLLAANDNESRGTSSSKLTTVVSNGATYRIKIDNKTSTNGSYVLNGNLRVFPTIPTPGGVTLVLKQVKGQYYQPLVSWNQVPTAVKYEVNLLKSSNRVNGLSTTNTNWTNGPQIALSNLPASTYGVQVRAVSNNLASPWSAVVPGIIAP